MNKEIQFAGASPVMDGTWYNPKTGDQITIRDTFMENNSIMVSTTDGRMLDAMALQNYIKVDKNTKLPSAPKKTQTASEIPQEILNELDGEDNPLTRPIQPRSLDEIDTKMNTESSIERLAGMTPDAPHVVSGPKTSPQPLGNIYAEPQPQQNVDRAIIERALGGLRTEFQPELTVEVKWDNYPKEQIDVLMTVMGMSDHQIIEYYLDKIDTQGFVEKMYDSLKKFIIKQISVSPAEETQPAVQKKNVEEPETKPAPVQKKTGRKPGKKTEGSSKKVVKK